MTSVDEQRHLQSQRDPLHRRSAHHDEFGVVVQALLPGPAAGVGRLVAGGVVDVALPAHPGAHGVERFVFAPAGDGIHYSHCWASW